jgi:hypothetical protein
MSVNPIIAGAEQALQPGGSALTGGDANVTTPASSPLAGLANIGAFFDKLGEASTWIRVAEVLLGAALILTGVAKLISGTPVGKIAGTAAKAAVL